MFNYRKHRAKLPREITGHSVAATLARLSVDAENMSLAELRGYVRAHALPCVREEALKLVSREWPKAAFDELVAAALEQTVHHVVHHLDTYPLSAMPTPHVGQRFAA